LHFIGIDPVRVPGYGSSQNLVVRIISGQGPQKNPLKKKYKFSAGFGGFRVGNLYLLAELAGSLSQSSRPHCGSLQLSPHLLTGFQGGTLWQKSRGED